MYHVIHALRTYLGMSQTQLARKANITQPDLCELETKPPYGYMDKYVRLSRGLGVPVEALVKNDFTLVPKSFFEQHPPQEYTPIPQEQSALLGRQGEEFILRRERERLAECYPTLAKLVLPRYKMKGSSPGYDILSFDDDGKPIFLEVKTSISTNLSFRMTSHELKSARELTDEGERYIVVCVSGWGTEEQRVREIPFGEMGKTHKIEPNHYWCRPIPKCELHPISGLAHFRKLRGLRQEDVSAALDITQHELSLYETGSRRAPVSIYIKASELLEATLDELLASYDNGKMVAAHGQ